MLTQGRGAHVKNHMTKLTINNLVKPVLSSHCENIAAAEVCKLPTATAPHISQSAQTSSTLSMAAPPSMTGPSITNVDIGQASPSAPATKHSFKATVEDEEDDFSQSSNSESAPLPGKEKEKKKKKKKPKRACKEVCKPLHSRTYLTVN